MNDMRKLINIINESTSPDQQAVWRDHLRSQPYDKSGYNAVINAEHGEVLYVGTPEECQAWIEETPSRLEIQDYLGDRCVVYWRGDPEDYREEWFVGTREECEAFVNAP